jgi:N-acetyltransferase B complex (NatB) non catalytic subunit
LLDEVKEILNDAMKVAPDSRDLHLGLLRVLRLQRAKNECTDGNLAHACQQYFKRSSRRLYCFDDLREAVHFLSADSLGHFLKFVEDTVRSNSQVPASPAIPRLNELKVGYCFSISKAEEAGLVTAFLPRILRRYRDTLADDGIDHEITAQIATLACMALFRAHQLSQENGRNNQSGFVSQLQAAALLRYHMTRSEDNYATFIVLSRLLVLSGSLSLSAKCFKDLSIKNLQWENAGHLMLTRLSTLHPQRSKTSIGTFEPLQMFDLALITNTNSIRSSRRQIMVGLNHKSYVNVLESLTLKDDLRKSFSKQLFRLENDRIRRLRDVGTSVSTVSLGKKQAD